MAVEFGADEVDRKRQGERERNKELRLAAARDPGLEIPPELINPDPEKHYKKVFYKPGNRGRIARFQGRGYRLTPPDSKTKIPGARIEDGMQIDGEDLVLMETSNDNYRKRQQNIRDRAQRFSIAAREEANEKLNQVARDAGLIGPHQRVAFNLSEPEKE